MGRRAWTLMRNGWRQLTSMRTALILLFLLALGSIPGSVLPQRAVNLEKVNTYFQTHPDLAPVLDRLWAFEVFSSPWYSAIYLLLFTSLIGCVVPRLRDHIRALRSVPPKVPSRMDRLPQHESNVEYAGDASTLADQLRRQRWRVSLRGQEVSAEKGYLKETGNLLFHFALIGVLLGVALGTWWGWHGNRLLVAGPDGAFCNSVQQFDEYGLGPRVSPGDLPGFCLELDQFQASYLDNGQPETFNAKVSVSGAGTDRKADFSVNSPLRLPGANVYLLGNGYAPILRYTDRAGGSQTIAAPFLVVDGQMTSEGVAAFPDVNGRARDLQVAFEGLYLPTAPASPPYTRSVYPDERDPALLLFFYRGNLGMDAGIPQSVYRLNQRQVQAKQLNRIGEPKLLRKGESWALDDGTKVEFLGSRRWVTVSVRSDPGTVIVLVSTGLLLIGLVPALLGRRRRVWFRVSPSTTTGSNLLEVGGLPRTEYPGFAEEFTALVDTVRKKDD